MLVAKGKQDLFLATLRWKKATQKRELKLHCLILCFSDYIQAGAF